MQKYSKILSNGMPLVKHWNIFFLFNEIYEERGTILGI